MNKSIDSNAEKIRNLLNDLQESMPILSGMKKLEFNIPMISFEYYKNHIETIFSLCKENLLCTLSWRLFKQFFEGEGYFLEFSEKKESDIGLIIDIIQRDDIQLAYQKILLSRGLNEKGKLFKNCFTDLANKLESININDKIITIFIIFFLNNELTLPALIKELSILLTDKYPKCIINLENVIKENINSFDFINQFNNIKEKFENNTELIWDDKEKKLKIINKSSNEQINDKKENIKKKAKKKKNKKNEICENNNNIKKKDEKENEKNIIDNNLKNEEKKEKLEKDKTKEEYEQIISDLKKQIESLQIQLLEYKNKLEQKNC